MSLLNEIKNKKNQLKNCQTVVTSIAGTRHVENRNEKGGVEITELPDKCPGFVVNDKPDLQIGRILPYLFLSSQDVAHDLDLLNQNSITHLLSIGVELADPNPGIIKHRTIHLLDEPNSDITRALASATEFIENARQENENNRILVHCNAGYSRAPTIVIGYLMSKFGYTLNESYDIVKRKRNVKPNDGFMRQLAMLEQKSDL